MKPPVRPLYKQHSWSPDTERENQWQRRKGTVKNNKGIVRCSKSVTDDELDELKGCIDLGFGFVPNSPDFDPKLADSFPALGFYCKVNRQYGKALSRSSSTSSFASDSTDFNSLFGDSIFDPGEDPETVKARLRQWAQVVACSVRQGNPID